MADKFEQFVRDMAALTTPDDPEEIAQMRVDYAKNYGAKLESEADDEEVIDAMLTGDFEGEEASALWEMIRQARKLLRDDK